MRTWTILDPMGWPLEQVYSDLHPSKTGNGSGSWIETPRFAEPNERWIDSQWVLDIGAVESEQLADLNEVEPAAAVALRLEIASLDALPNKAAPGVRINHPWLAEIADEAGVSLAAAADIARPVVEEKTILLRKATAIALGGAHRIKNAGSALEKRKRGRAAKVKMENLK